MPKKRLVIPDGMRLTQYVSYRQPGSPFTTYGYVIGFFNGYTREEYEAHPGWNIEPSPWLSSDPQVHVVYESCLPIANTWFLYEEYMPFRRVTFHSAKEFERLLDEALSNPPPVEWPAWAQPNRRRGRGTIEPFLRLD